ncbi:hypothetical protein Bpfe_011371 [Biomphalaria pfeifferi]|uniref:RRM domain-containing protein n=1 Tax=Biomphalaria pfeifferi TaxID=112525 RepID=A0AAD8BT11_BIOPF|nr:hypothetical protein Bpfe_011371 [Biomphalaria pfeifferi]
MDEEPKPAEEGEGSSHLLQDPKDTVEELLTLQEPCFEIIEIAKENCPVKKGKVCFLGPLSSYLDVKKIKNQLKEKKETCITGQSGELKSILKRKVRPSLPSIATFHLHSLADETVQHDATTTVVNEVGQLDYKCVTTHPSCYEITHRKNSARKTVSMQSGFHSANRVVWISTCPEDLNNVPAHSLLIRWKLSFTVPCYTIESVYTVLTRYGDITCLVHLSPNSALVVFKDELSARTVASAGFIGFKQCPLMCSWFFKKMYKDRFAPIKRRKKFYRPTADEIFVSHIRQQQKIITTCFRLHAPNMFYDHTTYIP